MSTLTAFQNLTLNNVQQIEMFQGNLQHLHHTVNKPITLDTEKVDQLFNVLNEMSENLKKLVQITETKKPESFLVTVTKESLLATIRALIALVGYPGGN